MMRLLCLPVDSRPCGTQFIFRMGTWAGVECVFPRAEEMDYFKSPAPHEGSRAFLMRELPRCDGAIISLDHWCYGGLLGSREEGVSDAEALARVEELSNILSAYPRVPVYMSSIIQRSSISTLTRGDLGAYQAMTEYSVYADRRDRFGLPEDEEKMRGAEKRLPPGLLEKALWVRQRNVRVNLAAVDLAAAGLVSSLSMLQEDCQLFGLPRRDQRRILNRIAEKKASNVFLRNGADEGGALSLGAALQRGRLPLPAEIIYLGEKNFTAPYEDRPFQENLLSACREAGIVDTPGAENVICVCCPEKGEQKEADQSSDPEFLGFCAREIDGLIAAGRRVYLLDVIRANGGSLGLLKAMREADGLWGYSGWNTASNAMGTLLCQVITDHIHGGPNRRYFYERLLDDLIYQAGVRKQLNQELRALGEDVFCLSDQGRAEEILARLYQERMPQLWPLKDIPAYRVALPWGRTFEVLAEVTEDEN